MGRSEPTSERKQLADCSVPVHPLGLRIGRASLLADPPSWGTRPDKASYLDPPCPSVDGFAA